MKHFPVTGTWLCPSSPKSSHYLAPPLPHSGHQYYLVQLGASKKDPSDPTAALLTDWSPPRAVAKCLTIIQGTGGFLLSDSLDQILALTLCIMD